MRDRSVPNSPPSGRLHPTPRAKPDTGRCRRSRRSEPTASIAPATSSTEIRLCEATGCALWPFRAGRHPWHALSQKTGQSDGVFEQGEASQDEGSPA